MSWETCIILMGMECSIGVGCRYVSPLHMMKQKISTVHNLSVVDLLVRMSVMWSRQFKAAVQSRSIICTSPVPPSTAQRIGKSRLALLKVTDHHDLLAMRSLVGKD